MEKLSTKRQQESAGKKKSVFGVLALCLVLGNGLIISVIVLGSVIGRFSQNDVNVIALLPPEDSLLQAQNAAGQTGTPAAQRTIGASSASGSSSGVTSYTASPAGASGEYRGDLQVEHDGQSWESETRIDLFKSSYDGTVQSEKGDKVIAPGTSNYYNFIVKNNGTIPLDYTISLKVDTHLGQQETYSNLPVEWRLLDAGGSAINEWQTYNERTEVLRTATLDTRRQDGYTIEWRWAFDEGAAADQADTIAGNLAVSERLDVDAEIYIYAEQSAGWQPGQSSFADPVKTGDTANTGLYIVLAGAAVGGLVVIFFARKRGKKEEAKQDERQ